MSHHQTEDGVDLIEGLELARVLHRPTKYVRVILARHYGFGTRHEGGRRSRRVLRCSSPCRLCKHGEIQPADPTRDRLAALASERLALSSTETEPKQRTTNVHSPSPPSAVA